MDYIPSLVFPFDRTDPHDDQLPCQQQYHTAGQQNDNQLIFNPLEYGSDLKRPETTNIFAVNDDNSKKMKIMRRDIERHRRQEMSTLYRSLRSLLPLEYLKGKRSMSDHMNEAVNYIKNLQNRIQKLSEKRDELRRLSNSSSSPYYSTTSESECSQTHIILEDSVTVKPCLAGVEVAINTSFRKGIPLSQVVALLTEEGLTVVICISTKINERLLHNIESELGGKRVGIVGLGSIGSEVAKRLVPFGCSIAYTSRKKKPGVLYPFYANVSGLAADSDVLIVCCALTEETHHMINKDVMTALGKEGVIINVGRGALIDEKELVHFLVRGKLGGAGLDVFEDEPHVPKELLTLDNVVLSPHVAVVTAESFAALEQVVIGNLEAFFSNKPLLSPVKLE